MHDEVVHYRDNGFVVIEEFLDPTELDDWRNAVDEAVLLRGKDKVPWGEEDWPESAIFKQIMQLWMDNERMKAELEADRAKWGDESYHSGKGMEIVPAFFSTSARRSRCSW